MASELKIAFYNVNPVYYLPVRFKQSAFSFQITKVSFFLSYRKYYQILRS